jgi:hypothetical protein
MTTKIFEPIYKDKHDMRIESTNYMETKQMKSTLAATLVVSNHENGTKRRLYITIWRVLIPRVIFEQLFMIGNGFEKST